MPPAKVKNAPGLDIIFEEGSPQILIPGQTLSGKAVLSTTEESVSIGSVTATLYGRTKCKVYQSHGQSASVHNSRARLFEIKQELFKSDYTYGAGDYSWPFSFQLPFVADESCLTGKKKDRFKPDKHFLSTDNIDVIEHEMPPPVYHYHGMFGRAVWAYVEYVLEVTVTDAPSSHRIRGPQSITSTRPLNFQPGRREEILRDYGLQTKSEQLTIKSSRLVSNEANLTPTTSATQNQSLAPTTSNEPIVKTESRGSSPLRNVFSKLSVSSSSTPRIGLNCTVTYPTTFQVYHPDPIPFRLSITPDPDPQATNIDPSAFPTIRIKSFDLRLLCTTRARALTGLWQERDSKTVSIYLAKDAPVNHSFSLAPHTSSKKAEQDSTLAFQNSLPNTTDNSNTITLTTLLSTPPRLLSAKTGRRLREPLLIPTFKTYNLAREFGLKWVIELEIVTPQKVFTEKLKGEVEKGGITVRGVPDGLRAEAMASAGMDGAVPDYEALERGDERDDGEEDEDDNNAHGEGGGAGASDEKKGLRSLFRRSHDGGVGARLGRDQGNDKDKDKDKEKEEYAREDRAQAQAEHPAHGEQLPKYEA